MELTWLPVLIFFARIADVSVGTIRIICVTRGFRGLAVGLAFVEIVIWVSALSAVVAHLDRLENIVAFAAGFATGNAVGMWLEQKLALGTQIVGFVSPGRGQAVAARLRFNDFIVTTLDGNGRNGPVAVCLVVVPRRSVRTVIKMAREIDPDVVVTVADVREWSGSFASRQLPGKIPASVCQPFRRVAASAPAGIFPNRYGLN